MQKYIFVVDYCCIFHKKNSNFRLFPQSVYWNWGILGQNPTETREMRMGDRGKRNIWTEQKTSDIRTSVTVTLSCRRRESRVNGQFRCGRVKTTSTDETEHNKWRQLGQSGTSGTCFFTVWTLKRRRKNAFQLWWSGFSSPTFQPALLLQQDESKDQWDVVFLCFKL